LWGRKITDQTTVQVEEKTWGKEREEGEFATFSHCSGTSLLLPHLLNILFPYSLVLKLVFIVYL
jgi:hypothetical protein